MTDQINAHDFDLGAWLDGASRPTRTVTVYRDGRLLAELDSLAQQIKHLEDAGVGEELSLSEEHPADALRREYADLARKFEAGALTLRIQSGTLDEERRIKSGRDPKRDFDAINRDFVHAALVEPQMTREQFGRLVDAIGVYQWTKILSTYQAASSDDVMPDADFLPRFSTRGSGD